MNPTELLMKYEKLKTILKNYGSCAVAFSGGVDSTLLAFAAYKTLGARSAAITAIGAMTAGFEKADALEMAKAIGIPHTTFNVDIATIPHFSENGEERCYHCKKAIFENILKKARELELAVVVDGSNTDDCRDYRPGKRALLELGIRSPLLEAELSKQEIRALSKHFGLKTFDKPNFACLASRVPYGEPLTAEKMHQIDLAEQILRNHGFRQFRVRHHGTVARIEIEPSEIPNLLNVTLMQSIATEIQAVGFNYVALDMEGYQTGSMNRNIQNKG